MADQYASKINELKKKLLSLEKQARAKAAASNKKHTDHKKSVQKDLRKHKKEIDSHKQEVNKYKAEVKRLSAKLKKLEQKKQRAMLRPTTGFKSSMGNLNKNVQSLLKLLEQAHEELGEDKLQVDQDILNKLETLLSQNEKIAQGILAIVDFMKKGSDWGASTVQAGVAGAGQPVASQLGTADWGQNPEPAGAPVQGIQTTPDTEAQEPADLGFAEAPQSADATAPMEQAGPGQFDQNEPGTPPVEPAPTEMPAADANPMQPMDTNPAQPMDANTIQR